MSERTLTELFEFRVGESGDAPGLRFFNGKDWTIVSFADWYRMVTLTAAGLIQRGVQRGDRVGIASRTRWEWVVVDQAILLCGAVSVPIAEQSRSKQLRLFVEDAGIKALFVDDPVNLEKATAFLGETAGLGTVIWFDDVSAPRRPGARQRRMEDLVIPTERSADVFSLQTLRELGSRAISHDPNLLARRKREAAATDLASIVYTPGTTGRPRGIELTHANFRAAIEAFGSVLPVERGDEHLLILPLSQILARIMYLTAMSRGAITSFSRGFDDLVNDLAFVRPHFFAGVPRIFDRLLDTARRGFAGDNPVTKKLFDRTVWLIARQHDDDETLTTFRRLELQALNMVVGGAIRRVFGGRVRFAITGAASISPDLLRTLRGVDVPVLQGYGLTATCAAVAVERLDANRLGTSGRALPNVEIRCAEDGELLVRGPNVTSRFWNNPEETAAAFADGWFRTGDIGRIDDGFVSITERKRDIIVTSGGKLIAPAPIEALVEECPFVKFAVVHGEQRDFLSALITLDEGHVLEWARENELGNLSFAELSRHHVVYELIEAHLEKVNRDLAGGESVKRFAILQSSFSSESGELSATGLTRRKFVTEKFRAVLDELYKDPGRA
jgi:long-chain acyl-CoA synthetase